MSLRPNRPTTREVERRPMVSQAVDRLESDRIADPNLLARARAAI